MNSNTSNISNNIYNKFQLKEKLLLMPNQITNNINSLLLTLLKKKVGNKCIKEGYVEKNSIKILKRSIGKINSAYLNGSMSFSIIYTANVCNPKKGDIIECNVLDVNAMGVLAELKNAPLTIVLPKTIHTGKLLQEFKKIKDIEENNYVIKCEIIGKRWYLNETSIYIYAKLMKVL